MEGLNRLIFLALGLVAVIIFFAVITGRINLRTQLPIFSKSQNNTTTEDENTQSSGGSLFGLLDKKPTSTPAPRKPPVSPTPTKLTSINSTSSTKPPTNIPKTGISLLFIPFSLFSLGAGIYLKKRT